MDSSRISPTRHYTGWVWYRNGLSHPALVSPVGRVLHAALRPVNAVYERVGSRPGLDEMLLARHRALDWLLERAIAAGEVGQVLEVAAGSSPRGWRFTRRFPELTYVEADLPEVAEAKRRALDAAGLRRAGHEVVAIDALADDGPASLAAVAAARLDPGRGLAIVTEGLLSYFDRAAVDAIWRRFAAALRRHPRGVYLSDLHLAGDVGGMSAARPFQLLLSAFARGKVHLHFADSAAAEAAAAAAGFAAVRLHAPEALPLASPARRKAHVVRILEART